MTDMQKQCCLWGVWLFWGASIIAFSLSIKTPLLISLGVMVCLILQLLISSLYTKRNIAKVFNFNRKGNSQAGESLSSPGEVENNVPSLSPLHNDGSGKETVISIGTLLTGEITNENNISINGTVEGDLISHKVAQIGREGKVIGKVKSVKLVVNGLLKGSCYAKTVIILSNGKIEGEVFAAEFSIEKGGVFIGSSHQIEASQLLPEKKEKKQTIATAEHSPALIAVDNAQGKVDNPLGKNLAAGQRK